MGKITVKTRGPKAFRRGGRDFGPEPTELDLGTLTPEQIEQIRAESGDGGMLEVIGLPGAPAGARVEPSPAPAAVEHETERSGRRR
jgi:hypothetical protein